MMNGAATRVTTAQAARFEQSKLEATMAEPRAFVSFDFDDDESSRNLFAGQAKKDSPTPFTVQDWSSRTTLPQAT